MKKNVKISESALSTLIHDTIMEAMNGALENSVNKRELAQYCMSGTDFLFVAKSPLGEGFKLRAANAEDIQNSIAGEVLLADKLEISHDIDSMIEGKAAPEATVVKVIYEREVYYIVWER